MKSKLSERFSKLKEMAGVRWILLLFLLLLFVVGIFAWMFRHVLVGYSDTDGYVITDEAMSGYLTQGNDAEVTSVALEHVKEGEAFYMQGTDWFFGGDWTEFLSRFPLITNDGSALYFVKDGSSLITSEFMDMDIYGGMYLSDGTAFNTDRSQAYDERIYLADLGGELHANALPIRFYNKGYDITMQMNSIVYFGEKVCRFYTLAGDELVYTTIDYLDGAHVVIDGKDFTYQEFYEKLYPSAKDEGTMPSPKTDGEEDPEDEKETPEHDRDRGSVSIEEDKQTAESQAAEGSKPGSWQQAAPEQTAGTVQPGSSTAGNSKKEEGSSDDHDSRSESDSDGKGDTSDEDDSESTEGSSGSGSGQGSQDKPKKEFQIPAVDAKITGIGVYNADLSIQIKDPSKCLAQVSAVLTYTDRVTGRTRTIPKTFTFSGDYNYTFDNIRSDQDFELTITVRYYDEKDPQHKGTPLTKELYHFTPQKDGCHTLSIEEGIDPVILTFQPDDGTDETGYKPIYAHQIEIHNLHAEQMGLIEMNNKDRNTLSYARNFRVKLTKDGKELEDMPSIGASVRTKMYEDGGVNWKSDDTMELPSNSTLVYSFEVADRFGDILPVVYEAQDGETPVDKYLEKGNYVSQRTANAYTCTQAPLVTRLNISRPSDRSESYQTGLVTLTLSNEELADVTDLYMMIQDQEGFYIGYKLDENGDLMVDENGNPQPGLTLDPEGITGTTDKTAIQTRYQLMGADTYDHVEPYDTTKAEQTWEKIKIPAFAGTTYKVSVWGEYDCKDRTGKQLKELRTASYTSGNLTDAVNISFIRANEPTERPIGTTWADYYYTVKGGNSSAGLGLLDSLEYMLKADDDKASEVMKFTAKKDALTLEMDGKTYKVTENKFRYSYMVETVTTATAQIFVKTTTTDADGKENSVTTQRPDKKTTETVQREVTGVISYNENTGEIERTIYIQDPETGKYVLVGTRTISVDAAASETAEQAMQRALGFGYDDDADLLADYLKASAATEKTTTEENKSTGVTKETTVTTTYSNASKMAENTSVQVGLWMEGASANYSDGSFDDKAVVAVSVAGMQKIYAKMNDDGKNFEKAFFEILTEGEEYNEALHFSANTLKPLSVYNASAMAYAKQADESAPQAVTTANSLLNIKTYREAPTVNVKDENCFASSSKLTIYDFYVLDPYETVRTGSVTIELYEKDKYDPENPGSSLPLITRTWDTVKSGEELAKLSEEDKTLSFSGLQDDTEYIILVKAPRYDDTPSGNADTHINYLIGDGNVSSAAGQKQNGTWYYTTGESVVTDLNLDYAQYGMNVAVQENQLIDENELAIGTINNWGVFSKVTSGNAGYTVFSGLIDIRAVDENGNRTEVEPGAVFLGRNLAIGRVWFYDEDGNPMGSRDYPGLGERSNDSAVTARDSYYLVTVPSEFTERTNAKGEEGKKVAYVRVSCYRNLVNKFYFGRLPQDQEGYGFTDLYARLLAGGNKYEEYIAAYDKIEGSDGAFSKRYKNLSAIYHEDDVSYKKSVGWPMSLAEGDPAVSVNLGWYYWPCALNVSSHTEEDIAKIKERLIPVKEGGLFMVTSNSLSGYNPEKQSRDVVFLDKDLRLVRIYDESGARSQAYSYKRTCIYGEIYVAPQGACYMLLNMDNGNHEPNRRVGVYTLDDASYSKNYQNFLSGKGFEGGHGAGFDSTPVSDTNPDGIQRGYTLSTNASRMGSLTNAGSGVETTGYISVRPGDVYMVNNADQNVFFYEKNPGYGATPLEIRKAYSFYNTVGSGNPRYIVIPEGIHYIRIVNGRSGITAKVDRSFCNGNPDAEAYNHGRGCYTINYYYCGNIGLYEDCVQDSMKASVHVQIAGADVNSEMLSGKYQLRVYEKPYRESDSLTGVYGAKEDWVEEDFYQETPRVYDYEFIGTSCNVHRCVDVREDHAYMIELLVGVGESNSYESVGRIYMNVDRFEHVSIQNGKKTVYGISNGIQFYGINRDVTGSYILNRDVELNSTDYCATIANFYGVMDLQGHTLTNKRSGPVFTAVGRKNRSYGQIKHGSIRIDVHKYQASGGWLYYVSQNNYGTFRNINFINHIYDDDERSSYIYASNVSLIGNNYGTVENFSVRLDADLISRQRIVDNGNSISTYNPSTTGLIINNYGMVQNGILYSNPDAEDVAGYSIMGGKLVAGLINNNTGTARNLYGLVDVQARVSDIDEHDSRHPKDAEGNLYVNLSEIIAGTLVGQNSGKVENVFSTGGVYLYGADRTDAGWKLSKRIAPFTSYGCTVGRTSGSQRRNSGILYANKANRSFGYNNRYNTKIQMATLLTPDYLKSFFDDRTEDTIFDYSMMTAGSKFYPWVNMDTAEKYVMPKEQIRLDAGTDTELTLISWREEGRSFDDDGYETVRITFSMTNDKTSPYYVDEIQFEEKYLNYTKSLEDLDRIVEQGFNPDTGLWDVTMDIAIDTTQPDYQFSGGLHVSRLYYRLAHNTPRLTTPIYYGDSVGARGEFPVDVEFFYPISTLEQWEEHLSKNGVSAHPDWNYRIWRDLDFSKNVKIQDPNTLEVYEQQPSISVNTALTGSIDGTVWNKDGSGNWYKETDENGNIRCHVLSNLSDTCVNHSNPSRPAMSSMGYIFNKYTGHMSNLEFSNVALKHPTQQYYGLIGWLGSNNSGDYSASVLENIHVNGMTAQKTNSGVVYMGGLINIIQYDYASIVNCTVSDLSLADKVNSTGWNVGGIVAWTKAPIELRSCAVYNMQVQDAGCTGAVGVGGLIGSDSSEASILNCYTSGVIDSRCSNIGGLVGYQGGGTGCSPSIDSCYSSMAVTSTAANVGGLVGTTTSNLEIQNSLFAGTAFSEVTSGGRCHYLLGYRSGGGYTVSNSYAYDMNPNSGLMDHVDGLSMVSYEQLCTEDFYRTALGWDSYQSLSEEYAVEKGYLPAVDRDESQQLLSHQKRAAGLDNPELFNILSAEGGTIHAATGSDMVSTYYKVDLTIKLQDGLKLSGLEIAGAAHATGVPTASYDPAGISSLFDRTNVQVDALGYSYTGEDGSGSVAGMVVTKDAGQEGVYHITLNNVTLESYKDNYMMTVQAQPVDGGSVYTRVCNFQFVGGVSYEITNAYDWDLFFGYCVPDKNGKYNYNASSSLNTSQLLKLAEVVAALKEGTDYTREADGNVTITNFKPYPMHYSANNYGNSNAAFNVSATKDKPIVLTADEFETLLAIADGTYRPGYVDPNVVADKYFNYYNLNRKDASVNLKLSGDIDFGIYKKFGVSPTLNVRAGRVTGAGPDESGHARLRNLYVDGSIMSMSINAMKGLFSLISSDLTNVDFEDNTLVWNVHSTNSSAGLVGTIYGGVSDCGFSDNRISIYGSNIGMIGLVGENIRNVTVVNSYVDSKNGSNVGGLAGVLKGDLLDVTASGHTEDGAQGYHVTGASCVGGLVGCQYSSIHQLPEGGEYQWAAQKELADWDVYGEEIDSENHWYDWYWKEYSVQDTYGLVKNVSVDGLYVTSSSNILGGIVGRGTTSGGEAKASRTGDGYTLAKNISVKNVDLYSDFSGSSGHNIGGAFGHLYGVISDEVTISGVKAETRNYTYGRYVGGYIGYVVNMDSSSGMTWYNEETMENMDYYYSMLSNIRVEDTILRSTQGIGGVVGGFGNSRANMQDIQVTGLTLVGYTNTWATQWGNGGIAGYNFGGCALKDAIVKDSQLMSASGSVGGVSHNTGHMANVTVENTTVISTSTTAENTGGVSGIAGASTYDEELDFYGDRVYDKEHPVLTVKNVTVRGGRYTGGVFGSGGVYGHRYMKVEDVRVYSNTSSLYRNTNPNYATALNYPGNNVFYAYVGGVAGSLGSDSQPFESNTVRNVSVTYQGGGLYVGGIAGWFNAYTNDCTFENISVAAQLNPGIVRANLFYCSNRDTIRNYTDDRLYAYYGGLFGSQKLGMENCRIKNVTLHAHGGQYLGGIAGEMGNFGELRDCTVETVRVYADGAAIGGLYGVGYGLISNTIKDVKVDALGGFVGGLSGIQYAASNYNSIEDVTVAVSGSRESRTVPTTVTGPASGRSVTLKTGNYYWYCKAPEKRTMGNLAAALDECDPENLVIGYYMEKQGDSVGGLFGYVNSSVNYSRIRNITVSSSGDMTGGLVGTQITGYIQYTDGENIRVYSGGSHDVGGVVGATLANNTNVTGIYSSSFNDMTVTAPNASNVGGLAGTALTARIAGTQTYASTWCYCRFWCNDVKVDITDGRDNVGGGIGRALNVSDTVRNSIESRINASGSSVGGFIGAYESVNSAGGVLNFNITVTKVQGADYVSGMIGRVDKNSAFLWNSGGSGSSVLNDALVAAQVTATDPGATASYWYACDGPLLKGSAAETTDKAGVVIGTVKDQAAYADVQGAIPANPYPVRLRVWDGSTITVNGAAQPVKDYVVRRYWKKEGYSGTTSGTSWNRDAYIKMKYLPGLSEKEPETYIGNNLNIGPLSEGSLAYLPALVSTEDMQDPEFYTGNYNMSMSTILYADLRVEENIDGYEGANVFVPNIMTKEPTAGSGSLLGLYPELTGEYTTTVEVGGGSDAGGGNGTGVGGEAGGSGTGGEAGGGSVTVSGHYVYMPYRTNPLSLSAERVEKGGYAEHSPGRFYGTAEDIQMESGYLRYTLTDGICVPGTYGSLFGMTEGPDPAEEILAGGVRMEYNTITPYIYGSSGYLLNLNFDILDSFNHMTMKVYGAETSYEKATSYDSGAAYYEKVKSQSVDAGGDVRNPAVEYEYREASGVTESNYRSYYVKNDGYDTSDATVPEQMNQGYIRAAEYDDSKVYFKKENYEVYVPFHVTTYLGTVFIPTDGTVYEKDADGKYIPAVVDETVEGGDRYQDAKKTYYYRFLYAKYVPVTLTEEKFDKDIYYTSLEDASYTPTIYGELLEVDLDADAAEYGTDIYTVSIAYDYTTPLYVVFYRENGDIDGEYYIDPAALRSRGVSYNGYVFYTDGSGKLKQYRGDFATTVEKLRTLLGTTTDDSGNRTDTVFDVAEHPVLKEGERIVNVAASGSDLYLLEVPAEGGADSGNGTGSTGSGAGVTVQNIRYQLKNGTAQNIYYLYRTATLTRPVGIPSLIKWEDKTEIPSTFMLRAPGAEAPAPAEDSETAPGADGGETAPAEGSGPASGDGENESTALADDNSPVAGDESSPAEGGETAPTEGGGAAAEADGESSPAAGDKSTPTEGSGAAAAEESVPAAGNSPAAGNGSAPADDAEAANTASTVSSVIRVSVPNQVYFAQPSDVEVETVPADSDGVPADDSPASKDGESEPAALADSNRVPADDKGSGGAPAEGSGAGAGDTSAVGSGAAAGDTPAGESGAAADTPADSDGQTGGSAPASGSVLTDEDLEEEPEVIIVEQTDAAALFEFDYKDYHIRTYLTYSIIEKDGKELVRGMQLFVKNGVLYALNAPDKAVPGAIIIDTYQSESYMTMLDKDGKLVDLMDPLVYPENFVNSGIKNITNNLYSDSTIVMVEYENGKMLAFNYLNGKEVEGEEATGLDADLWAYLKSFLKEKLELVKVELSGAYEDAKRLKEQLEGLNWKDLLFADTDGDEAAAPVIDAEIPEGITAEDKETEDDEFSAIQGRPEDDITAGEETENGEEIEAGPVEADILDGEEADGTGVQDENLPSVPMMEGEEAGDIQEVSGNTDAAEGYVAGTAAPESAPAEAIEPENVTAAASDGSSLEEDFSDELLIVYDSEEEQYSLYSAADILKEPEERLSTVNDKVQDYLDKGNTLNLENVSVSASKVTVTDRRGLLILIITGSCMVVLLAVLGVHQYRNDQKVRRRRRR